MRTSYCARDYAFGQIMLTLRTEIGLTQEGLGHLLGVSRRSVGEWEAGSSYPKVEHLKQVMTLAVKNQVFPKGCEAEEIRSIWKAAHQKVPLDESWLCALLEPQHSRHLHLVLKPVEEAMISSSEPSLFPGSRIDWGEALAVPTFYGREQELAQLTQWVLQERCRVVSVLGMGGIGKSALLVNTMHQIAEHFEVVIFRSLRDAPPCETLLDGCLQVCSPQLLSVSSTPLEQRIRLLLEFFRTHRALVILDNLECLLQERDVRGRFRPGFEGYGLLLRRVAETMHQSCLLLTSREKPTELRPLEGRQLHSSVRSLRLVDLDVAACQQLLVTKEVIGTKSEQEQLIKMYGGNPLALKIVAETIFDFFGGEIGSFLAGDLVVFGSVADLLDEHFARLSVLEQSVLCWLAILREPVTIEELIAVLTTAPSSSQVLEAIDSLSRRSLIERGQRPASFTLQSVVLEYATSVLIAEATKEIQKSCLKWLLSHGLELAQVKEYVRQTQERLLVAQLLANLNDTARGEASVEERVCALLDQLRGWTDAAQGYGPANLIALLRLRRGHLRGLDLSQLSIRGASFQGVEMQDASLAGAILRDTSLTEAFDSLWSVAISRNGEYWAAGSRRGGVRVWRKGIQTLLLAWQAHTDTIENAMAFSPDERLLATGSWDGTLKVWELPSGALLWMGQHTNIVHKVTFAPDGKTIASSGIGGVITFWEVTSGKHVKTMLYDVESVYTMAWSPDGHLLACGMSDGTIRLWQMQNGLPTSCIRVLTGHTGWVMSLAFAPDGTHLASCGSGDPTVRLWDITSGETYRMLGRQTGEPSQCVAWSPDGHTIAYAGIGQTIWFWDVTQDRSRGAFHSDPTLFRSLAFAPDSHRLLSSSDDGILRIWDATSGQSLHSFRGYAVSFYNLAWSPNGSALASVGSDLQLTLWKTAGRVQPRTLRGHSQTTLGVAWSPDGQLLVSSGMDNAIRVWNPATGACLQVLRDVDFDSAVFCDLAWHPDGCLLASGTYMRGIHVWDMTTRTRLWIGWEQRTLIYRVAWSPDGKQLVSCGDDGSICLWEALSGTLLGRFQGHSGAVRGVAWNPDGTRLISGGGKGKGEMFIWEVANREVVQAWRDLPEKIGAVAWSPGGNVVISGGSEGNLHWWEVDSGQCLATRRGHNGRVRALRVSPDGRLLASSGDESVIRIWDIESAELRQTLRRDRPYERLTITGIKGVNEVQKGVMRALGAYEEEAILAT